MQLSELEQQMSDKLELTNQMNLLLVQRAARIDELETLVGSCDANKQVSVPHVPTCNMMSYLTGNKTIRF